jgi:hypothetical protein
MPKYEGYTEIRLDMRASDEEISKKLVEGMTSIRVEFVNRIRELFYFTCLSSEREKEIQIKKLKTFLFNIGYTAKPVLGLKNRISFLTQIITLSDRTIFPELDYIFYDPLIDRNVEVRALHSRKSLLKRNKKYVL